MISLLRTATEDPLWAVEALLPLLDDYGTPIPVSLDLGRDQVVEGDLVAIDQGIAVVRLGGGAVRLVPLERVQRVLVDAQ